jgi:hypothetical protein
MDRLFCFPKPARQSWLKINFVFLQTTHRALALNFGQVTLAQTN